MARPRRFCREFDGAEAGPGGQRGAEGGGGEGGEEGSLAKMCKIPSRSSANSHRSVVLKLRMSESAELTSDAVTEVTGVLASDRDDWQKG